jgi:hypothetical protein
MQQNSLGEHVFGEDGKCPFCGESKQYFDSRLQRGRYACGFSRDAHVITTICGITPENKEVKLMVDDSLGSYL